MKQRDLNNPFLFRWADGVHGIVFLERTWTLLRVRRRIFLRTLQDRVGCSRMTLLTNLGRLWVLGLVEREGNYVVLSKKGSKL